MGLRFRLLRLPLLFLTLIVLLSACGTPPPIYSSWAPPTEPTAVALRGVAVPVAPTPTVSPEVAERRARGFAVSPGDTALAAYTAASTLNDSAADGDVRFFTRQLPEGGRIDYVVAVLTERVRFGVITANGAQLGSDATGDTIWVDGGRHLQPVATMFAAPYAARPDYELVMAMAFGFHGAERTSDEGTVVIDGAVQRVNPWRSVLCIGPDRSATINFFDPHAINQCEQAAGAGPVTIWRGKIANPAVHSETDEFLPFNPLDENFVQLSYRIENYQNLRPKTAIGVGMLSDGRSYLVLANSRDTTGMALARALRDLGCYDATGGDEGSSTQMVWRGAPVAGVVGRGVPSAVAIYVR